MMPSNNVMLLKPSSVSEVVEGLLESDIIGKGNIVNLKNDENKIRDPNVMMYVRHREAKKKSLIKDIEFHSRCNKTIKEAHQESVAPKDLKTIDVEIAKTKKNLEVFKKQLVKKTQSFIKSVHCLEMIEEHNETPQRLTSLSEEETKNCFNKHLDVLENQEEETCLENDVWKPFTERTSSVINIVAKSNMYSDCSTEEDFDPEELEWLRKCQTSPTFGNQENLNLSTNNVQRPMHKNITNTVPNNSPALISFTADSHNDKRILLAQNALQTWKKYVIKKTSERFKQVKKVFDIMTMRNIFTSWSMYVKCVKEVNPKKRENTESKTLLVPLRCKKKNTFGDSSKEESRIPLELHKTTIEPCLVSDFITSKSSYHEVILSSDSNSKAHIEHNVKNCQETHRADPLGNSQANVTLPKLIVQELVPDSFDMKNITPKENTTRKEETTLKKPLQVEERSKLKALEGFPKSHNSFEYRYVAQEKIITQQMAVIEKQKQIIFDLQAEHLQKQSDLGLKLVETQLAQVSANYRKKLKPVIKIDRGADSKAKSKETKKQNIQDLAERLTKSLKERQEYCKQLAEKTKMRKLLHEEQKKKQQIELEEMERQKKEEERRQKMLKIKMEKKVAEEKFKKELASKLQKEENIQRVICHHKTMILRTYFQKLRKITIMVCEKSKECDEIYKRKLTKRILFEWKNEANYRVNERIQSAYKYHETRLIARCWDIWLGQHREFKIKVQVSEDMFELKLQERVLRRWLAYTAKSYLRNCFKLELADRLCRRQLLRRCLKRWREWPKQVFSERQRETRCRAWRQTVQELVPDFSPVFAEQFQV